MASKRHTKTAKLLGTNAYETTHFQSAPPGSNDLYIIARKYDRLDLLAHKYYGDRNLWWIIAVSNEMVNGSVVVPAGKRIRIPASGKGFLNSIDKSTFDIKSDSGGGLPDGLGGGGY